MCVVNYVQLGRLRLTSQGRYLVSANDFGHPVPLLRTQAPHRAQSRSAGQTNPATTMFRTGYHRNCGSAVGLRHREVGLFDMFSVDMMQWIQSGIKTCRHKSLKPATAQDRFRICLCGHCEWPHHGPTTKGTVMWRLNRARQPNAPCSTEGISGQGTWQKKELEMSDLVNRDTFRRRLR